ncbi:uncharacterized protein cubi_00745 [Cryptosporidium ubiquitum]|uniref:Uncharacterized protein n=1 Tax=Cryptosporidium ubiquitum TaxID=857276 RepID=A0A1J4MCH9_9CRYT|nr:uncharacterized protein cubi_00745 [Cryptosporidium ubiquitum]OII71937.1 hypothetical protein cubi_00745 [Cryptosporidium ubiquitum]
MITSRSILNVFLFSVIALPSAKDFFHYRCQNFFVRSQELKNNRYDGISFGIDLEADNQMMENILSNIEQDKSLNDDLESPNREGLVSGFSRIEDYHPNEKIQYEADEDSFVKFDTRMMRHFSIEDITFNNTIRNYDNEKSKYHRVIKSGIKFAEYSLELSRRQRKRTFISTGARKHKILHLNQERSIASASIIASVTILKSLLYRELPTNTRWVYYSFYPLILSSYLQAYKDFKTESKPKGFFSKSMHKKKNLALFRLNKSLIRISRHINSLESDGSYNYSVKPRHFWRLVEPTIVSPAHGLITTDLIKKPKSLSGEYLKEVMSILKSNKYKLAIAQNKAREDFYYYINHDLEMVKD